MKPSLFRGTHVSHRLYGSGIILDEWGSWYSCRSCYVEIRSNQRQCSECAARANSPTANPMFLDEPPYPLQVSGKGTYDVLFSDGKTRAINLCWLTVKHGLVAEPRSAA